MSMDFMQHPGTQAYLAANPNSVFRGHNQSVSNIPSFAAGGMMMPSGAVARPGAPMPTQNDGGPQMGADEPMPPDPAQIGQEAHQTAQADPELVQQIQAAMQQAMQNGELTYQELNIAIQLARMALANPTSYPQLRAYAIKNGLGTEADLSPTMDPQLLFALLLAGKAMEAKGGSTPTGGNAVPPNGQGKSGLLPEYNNGGMTGDKKHLAVLHPEEYVIPRDVVLYHGKKHMDKLVEQARAPKDDSAAN